MKRLHAYFLAYAAFAALAATSLVAENTPSKAAASELKWTEDYKAALAQAKKENKMLLLDFTGSDWCGWCIKLKKDVFSTPEFADWANKNFVLVEVDFPRKKKLSDATKAQNAELQKKHGIRGYPTIIILDSNEKKLAQAGYDGNVGKAWCDARDKEIAAAKDK